MNNAFVNKVPLALIMCALGACATPEAANDLADKTAANVGALRGQMARISEESRALATRRARGIAELNDANARTQSRYELDLALTKRTQPKDLETIQWIKDWVAEAEGITVKAASTAQARRDAIVAAQEKLDVKGSELQHIAEALAALAKTDGLGERAAFIGRFAKDVRDSISSIIEKGGKSAENASKLLDQLGIELKSKSQSK